MHGQVRDVVRATYAQLNSSHPDLTFVYGETQLAMGASILASSHAPKRFVR